MDNIKEKYKCRKCSKTFKVYPYEEEKTLCFKCSLIDKTVTGVETADNAFLRCKGWNGEIVIDWKYK